MDRDVNREDFGPAIATAMDRAAASPMRYGVDDCALWVADIQAPLLGYDPADYVRGRYSTRLGALRFVGARGLLGQLRKIARRRQWQRIAPTLAQPGDTGLTWTLTTSRGKQVPTLATVICRAPGWFVGRNEHGWTAVRADRVAVAWSVLDDALPNEAGVHVNLPALGVATRYCPTSAVAHEPISAALLLPSLFAGLGASAAVASALGTFVVSTVLSIGVSLVASLLRPSQGSSLDGNLSVNQAQNVQITERQPIPYKRVIVGSAYVGGALFYEQVNPPLLTMGVLLNYGQISGVDKIFIGTNQLSFSSIVENSILTPLGVVGQPNYPSRLRVSLRYGSDSQPIDPLIQQSTTTFFPVVSGATGTPLGNLTSGGGLAAAFNGTNVQTQANSASASPTGNFTGILGKDWGSGNSKYISKFSFYAPSNVVMSAFPVTVTLEGSNDNFVSDINLLATVPSASYAANSSVTVSTGIVTTTAYRCHRLNFAETGGSGAHSFQVSQVIFYEYLNQSFRQRGNATAVFEYNYGASQTEFISLWGQNARPNAYLVVRGVKIYDPRDPTQSMTDSTTWKFTNNATLVQTWYLTQSFGGRIPLANIRWDKTVLSANYDDELIGCNDGTMIARHTIDGVITLDTAPYDVMQKLLTANRAMLLESGGMVWVESSRPKSPTFTIHDRILASGIKYQGGKQKDQLVNKLQVRFVVPNQDYQIGDGPILNRTDLQTLDGEVLPATLALEYTQDHRRAQRLQKLFLLSSRLGKTITCSVDITLMATAADELIGSVGTFASDLFAGANGTYIVTAVGFSDDATTLTLALTEYDATIETQWNPEVDEQAFVLAFS